MLRQYLLGQAPEANLSLVEERFMTESSLYQELLILEEELVDEYVRGQMAPQDRTSFENYFLCSPERREKVQFAKAFNKYVALARAAEPAPDPVSSLDEIGIEDRESPAGFSPPDRPMPVKKGPFSFWPIQTPAWNYVFAGAVAVIVFGVFSLLVIRPLIAPPGAGRVFAITLTPGGPTRDGGGKIRTVSIPSETDTVQLKLILPPDQYQDYGVTLMGSDGKSVWTQEQLKSADDAANKFLLVNVPARLLKRDTYRLKLRARSDSPYEELATYTFLVN